MSLRGLMYATVMCRKLLNHALAAALVYATTPYSFAGDVITDGTIGTTPSTIVVLGDTIPDTYDIIESLGERSGTNLFHSFLTFNIDSGEIARFSEDVLGTTSNVISRVTGGTGSLINGTISNIPSANFWFVDTAGVMIGADATFDVSGALSIGSVDYIDFGGPRYYALPSNQVDAISTLTVNPADFGFLTGTSAGNLTIASLTLDDTGTGAGLEIGDIMLAGNAVTITDATIVNDPEASGSDITISAPGNLTLDSTTLGTVTENNAAGNITLSGGSVALIDGTEITSTASGVSGSAVDPVPGPLNLGSVGKSGDITIIGATGVTANIVGGVPGPGLTPVTISSTSNNVDSNGAGSVSIEATVGNVFLSGTSIASTTLTDLAGGTPGAISISASGGLTLDDVDLDTSSTSATDAGTIQLSGFDVSLNNGTQLNARGESAGSGTAGDIDIKATNRVLVNVDPISLLPTAGASVLIDTSAAGASNGGSDLTMIGGDVLLSNFNVNASNNSTAVSPDVGMVSITAIGGGTTAGALAIENSFLNGDSSSSGSAPGMLLS
ncbi:MAG: filamentous hemagglutinin N-terminal domain-containing protein, partial [Gammaproteobacteria bacterium]|nr:filamentous hemagglutinin N-terminal domain-containing protein [Gammaproteobacteria bacterium]